MKDDLEKFIARRKRTDPTFAKGFESGYQEFKCCYVKPANKPASLRRIWPGIDVRENSTQGSSKTRNPEL